MRTHLPTNGEQSCGTYDHVTDEFSIYTCFAACITSPAIVIVVFLSDVYGVCNASIVAIFARDEEQKLSNDVDSSA